jgi:hypothetical protein
MTSEEAMQIKQRAAKENGELVDMGGRRLLSVGNSEVLSVPFLVRQNEEYQTGDEFECYYDPETGALVYFPPRCSSSGSEEEPPESPESL